jgi:hypothetical protein
MPSNHNPLKYTDPSGYLWNPFKAIAKVWRGLWRGIKKYARVVVAWVIHSTVHMYQPHLINVFVSSKASEVFGGVLKNTLELL